MPSFLDRMRSSTVSSPYEALGIDAPRRGPQGLNPGILNRLREQRDIAGRRAALEEQAMMQDISIRGGEAIRNRRLSQKAEQPNVVYQPSLAEMQKPEMAAVDLAREEIGAKVGMGREEISSKEKIASFEGSLKDKQLQIEAWKAQNPEGKLVTSEDGRVSLVNPIDGSVTPTGLKSGDLSERQKLEMEQEGASALETQRQIGREKIVETQNASREAIARLNNQTQAPSQTKQEYFNRAQELRARNPKYADYITALPDGTLEIKEPGRWGDLSQNEYNHIVNFIFGGKLSVESPEAKPPEVGKLTDEQKQAIGSLLTPRGSVPITGSILDALPKVDIIRR